ncbi:hypothetical protein [Streptomyces sp. NPDC001652]|uniref:hypothetical protein n=1 Tax=Streptomyces sp. NPDC001652 TaxID=3154393 RepID=UPI003332C6F5
MHEKREIEAFLAVAGKLHFGRATDRMRLSTSRVTIMRTSNAMQRSRRTPQPQRTPPPDTDLDPPSAKPR